MATNWKTRVDKILSAEQQKLKAKYDDAEGSYRDTGYERYYKAMNKAEAELDELDEYRNSKLRIAEAESKARRYRKVLDDYMKSLTLYAGDHLGIERPVDETVKILKHRLEQALYEERLL